jgi:hypothetical protein
MLAIALELSRERPAYEAIATKFFEHFVAISHAINGICGEVGMWHEADGFYYDVVREPGGQAEHLRVRSLVGLVPLFAVLAVDLDTLDRLPHFCRRVKWYTRYRPTLCGNLRLFTEPGAGGVRLMAVADRDKLERVLPRVLDPEQFLSDHGLRSMSRSLGEHPYNCHGGVVAYEPAESASPMYGGNSNWRGPVWFPTNILLIDALRQYHHYFGPALTVELPRGSGRHTTLAGAADELSQRLCSIFLRNEGNQGRRPVFGGNDLFQFDPCWRDHVPFYEFFHGDTGAGLGASHQTGWTALVAELFPRPAGGPAWNNR